MDPLDSLERKIQKTRKSERARLLHGIYKQLAASDKGRQAHGEFRTAADKSPTEAHSLAQYVANKLQEAGLEHHAARLSEQYGLEGFDPFKGHLNHVGDWWDARKEYGSFTEWATEWIPSDPEYNVIVDFKFIRKGEKTSLELLMTHPRKGVIRALYIDSVSESEMPTAIAVLRDAGKKVLARFDNLPTHGRPTRDPTALREGYKGWNPQEDAMLDNPLIVERLGAKGFFTPGIEIIDFYFQRHTPVRDCDLCKGDGYSPEGRKLNQELADQLYGRQSHLDIQEMAFVYDLTSKNIADITEDEKRRLIELNEKANRKVPTGYASLSDEEREVLRQQRGKLDEFLGPDTLDRFALLEYRAEKNGIDIQCNVCAGNGSIPIGEEMLGLNLWIFDYERGRSRGVFINEIPESSLPRAFDLLGAARDRFARKFSTLPESDIQIAYERGFPDIAGALMGHY